MKKDSKQTKDAKPSVKSKRLKTVKPLENSANYAMYVVSEIDAFIRKKHGMGIIIDEGLIIGSAGDKVKATFTITLNS